MKRPYLLWKRGQLWYYRLAGGKTFHISGQTTRGKAEAYANKALGVVKVIFREALYREEIPQEPSASVVTVKYRKEGRAGRLHCRGETAPASDLERTTILVH